MPAQDVARRRVRCGVIPRPEMVPGHGEVGQATSRAGRSKTWAVACQKVPIAVNLMLSAITVILTRPDCQPSLTTVAAQPQCHLRTLWLWHHAAVAACGSIAPGSRQLGRAPAPSPVLRGRNRPVWDARTPSIVSGGPCGHDLAALGAAFRPQVDHPVGRSDHVEVVLDDHHRVALLDELVQHVEQVAGVVEVQPGRRLVEDVERAPGAAARQLPGQLDALRLAAATAWSPTAPARGSRGRPSAASSA